MIVNYKRNKVLLIAALLTAVFVFAAASESLWEGSAAMGRYGEFPFTGSYGSSNSFAQNAYVEVENLENGKRTRLIVVDRLSDPGLLMLLSNEAAQELEIYQDDIARIRVRLLSVGNSADTPVYDDLAYNPDPDINPSAALLTPDEMIETNESGKEESELPVEKTEPEEKPIEESIAEEKPIEESIAVEKPPLEEKILIEKEPEEVKSEDEIVIEEALPEIENDMPDDEGIAYIDPTVPDKDIVLEDSPSPEPELELISSGLSDTKPVYSDDKMLLASVLPDVVDKNLLEEDVQHITDISGYHKPLDSDEEPEVAELPLPETKISEEVVAMLVGDHLAINETAPENERLSSEYSIIPRVVAPEGDSPVYVENFNDAAPEPEENNLIASVIPLLPEREDPGIVEIIGEEVAETLPEYDENLEISLVPAGVKPPVFKEEETAVPAEEAVSEEPEVVVVEKEIEESAPIVSVPPDPDNNIEEPAEVAAEPALSGSIEIVTRLQKQKHYLQLGAFKEKKSAVKAAGSLDAAYPVTIFSDDSTSGSSYKLLLGPLSEDESGVMLYTFRSGGYSDAFIKRIE